MAKIFTIGFSGKSPDAFLDVLNAVRVRAVWDIRLWRTSTYVPFYPQHQKSLPDTKTVVLLGQIMNECTANCWLRDTRPLDFPRPTLTAFACYAQKNPPYNAIAASLLNTLQSKSPTLRLCIYKLTILLSSYKKYVCNP